MSKYLDQAGLAHYHGNVEKRPVQTFDTVASMQAATWLKVGMTCHTNGFHASGDGGAAYYTISASGTANGMDVLALQGGLFATLVVTETYVTPEQFGAYGDGTHDDTAAINRMIAAGNGSFSFFPKTYKTSAYITIDTNGVTIQGNGCTIDSGNASGFYVAESAHDLEFYGINFVQSFTVGSGAASNYGIAIASTTTTELYQAYNIRISDCSFDGGVMGIVATSCQNLEIANCKFGAFVYKPSDGAGGYGILTQSCHDVFIHDCMFKDGDYGRHDVYVSVSQLKTENKTSSNVTIERCRFDHSAMSKQSGGAYYSNTTVAVAVRAIDNFTLTDCVAIGATGLVAVNAADGPTVNCRVISCKTINPVYVDASAGPDEQRSAISRFRSDNDDVSSLFVSGLVVDSPDNASYQDASVSGGTIEYCNSRPCQRFYIGNVVTAIIHDIYVDHHSVINYTGSQTLNGHMYAINGGDYIAFVATGAGKAAGSFFDSQLMHYAVGNTGAVTTEAGKPHLRIVATIDSGTITLTFTDMAAPPFAMSFEPTLNPMVAAVTRVNAALAANQIYIRLYSMTGTQVTTGMYSRLFFS